MPSARSYAASAAALAPLGAPAAAQELLFPGEDVPAGLSYDGPAPAIATRQTGMVDTTEPPIACASTGSDEAGLSLPDFERFDEKTPTRTLKLREGINDCNGAKLTADDVVHPFARAKSVSGAPPIGRVLSDVGSHGFSPRADDRGVAGFGPAGARTTRSSSPRTRSIPAARRPSSAW